MFHFPPEVRVAQVKDNCSRTSAVIVTAKRYKNSAFPYLKMAKTKQHSSMIDEHLQASLKLALTSYNLRVSQRLPSVQGNSVSDLAVVGGIVNASCFNSRWEMLSANADQLHSRSSYLSGFVCVVRNSTTPTGKYRSPMIAKCDQQISLQVAFQFQIPLS
jgi:hypothetical protein